MTVSLVYLNGLFPTNHGSSCVGLLNSLSNISEGVACWHTLSGGLVRVFQPKKICYNIRKLKI